MIASTTFILIDVQEKLTEQMSDRDRLIKNLEILINGIQILGIPLLYTEHYPEKLGTTIEQLRTKLTDISPIRKQHFSCCAKVTFLEALKRLNSKTIVLAGIETHVCVFQTAIDLLNQDYKVELICDAVSSRHPINQDIALKRMAQEGVLLSTTEMFLFNCLKIASGDCFKQILQLVR